MPFFMLPMAIFFAAIIANFVLQLRFRNWLIDHHPEEYLRVERKGYPGEAIYRFLSMTRRRALNDPELDRRADHLLFAWIIGLLAFVAMAVLGMQMPR